jgi:hypothetical protein
MAAIAAMRNIKTILVGNCEGKRPFERKKCSKILY